MTLLLLFLQTSGIAILLVFLMIELFNFMSDGYHFIYGNGVDMVKQELNDLSLYFRSSSHIDAKGKSALKITTIKTEMSIVAPYVVLTKNDLTYRVFVFSKAYRLIRNRHKELQSMFPNPKKNKHINFNL